MPKISVVIPCYNQEKYITECLDSVATQTISDYEVIIVDDGSTDNSAAIISQYISDKDNFRLIRQNNRGVVSARNQAVAAAQGQYIYPLDADDIITPDCLEKLLSAMENRRGDIITNRVMLFGQSHGEMDLPYPNRQNLINGNCLINASLFRKTDFDRLGGYDSAFVHGQEDYDLWLGMALRLKLKIYKIPEILYFYRIKPDDESRNVQQRLKYKKETKRLLFRKYPQLCYLRTLRKIRDFFWQAQTKNRETVVQVLKLPVLKIKHNFDKTRITFLGLKFSRYPDFAKPTAENYACKLTKLRQDFGRRKLKVGFLVCEQAKWQYQSLYDEFARSPYFEPEVLVTEMIISHRGKQNFYKTIDDCYNFFCSLGLNVRWAYDRAHKRYLTADELGVDILFYQQPWELADCQHPVIVSKSALCCYSPYGMHLVELADNYNRQFHLNLWQMFVENEWVIEHFSQQIKQKITNCVAIGYPKLDVYVDPVKPAAGLKPLIIYAPHHSFEAHGLACATFENTGAAILQLARQYQDQVDWVFKPHPRFKTAVIKNKIMTEAEIDDYYAAWQKIGTIYEGGDYFGLFMRSSGMITDCCSFLGEYLPAGKPLFHLAGRENNFNDWAKSLICGYYEISDIAALSKEFERVIIRRDDYKKDERLSKIPLLFDPHVKTAQKIVNHLCTVLKNA